MTSIINYDQIKGLIYTEKATKLIANRKYIFDIDKSCNKNQVKSLIKNFFKVDVEKVNIINNPGKKKRFKGILGSTGKTKKAIVTLKENQTINFG